MTGKCQGYIFSDRQNIRIRIRIYTSKLSSQVHRRRPRCGALHFAQHWVQGRRRGSVLSRLLRHEVRAHWMHPLWAGEVTQMCFPCCFTLDQKLDISFSQYISSYVIKNQSKSLCDLADFFLKEIPYSDQILFRAFLDILKKNKPKKLKTQGNSHENWKQNSEKTQLELF